MLDQLNHRAPDSVGEGIDSDPTVREHPPRPASSWMHNLGKPLRILVSLAIFSWLAWRTDWAQIRDAFQRLRIELWIASFAVCLFMQVLSGLRWQLLAKPLGFRGSVWRYTAYYFIGMFFNLLLPTSVGGDVARSLYLNGRGHRRLAAFVTVLVDRATGLLILLLVAGVGVLISPIPLKSWIVFSVGGMVVAALVGFLLIRPASRWTKRFDRMRRLREYAKFYLRMPRLLLNTSIISLGVQSANVLSVWLLGLALGIDDIPPVYYWIVVPLVCILTLLPISVGGFGVREGSMVLLLAPLGVDEDLALCLSILWYSVLLAVGLCGGLICLLARFPRPSLRDEAEYRPLGMNKEVGP